MKIILFLFCFVIFSITAYADNNDSQYLTTLEKQKLEKLFLGSSKSLNVSSENKLSSTLTSISNNDDKDESNSNSLAYKKNELSGNDLSVTLIRYAWQQLFAPQKMGSNLETISRSPMHAHYFESNLILGDKVYAHPIASWELNHTYVTAIELRNKYQHDTVIHINHDICGEFLSSSIYPRIYLKSSGNKSSDSSVLFLISIKPFKDAIGVCNGIA